MMSHCKKTSGFSLIELMVVLAIVSSLMMLTGG
ncbi:prepilin-type N-terminal cleavage/methylation domain-containing protein [Pseudoalteromonas sp. M8]|nr:prepilin-type N-terminal cleavage/methylation domain-containing protein [Pseudoalteromonas sp. M8]